MHKTIKVTDIKWAYSKVLDTSTTEGFMNSLCLFVGEIIRSDEVGLIVWQHQPIMMVCIHKVDFETEATYAEMITFKDSGLKEMLNNLHLENKDPKIICSGFEVFCYRPKPEQPYHPKIYPTYIRAREQASRILDALYALIINPERGACVSFAQVSEKISKTFFKRLSNKNKNQHDHDEIRNFAIAVDTWMGEFYTNEIGSKQYKTKNRYPIAPKPLEGVELFIITSDEDDNLISYQTKV
ncbi:MAG: hypothetical protein RM049_00560 [Nostoc sp. DedQUE04]|uniref:hypothetical protein n=1 Tax=Nostoc sp. DedQUE04 TaxID=3075390 RepID=UPI002AD2102A|nr:hypothetical protein [Nostoc sp. DedQUE04]MDZ8133801.1 hypothetical protein [Nostoc sp. DedQUE04]